MAKQKKSSKALLRSGRNKPFRKNLPNKVNSSTKRRKALRAQRREAKQVGATSLMNPEREDCVFMRHPRGNKRDPMPVLVEMRDGGNQPWEYARISAVSPYDVKQLIEDNVARPLWHERVVTRRVAIFAETVVPETEIPEVSKEAVESEVSADDFFALLGL